MLDVTWATVIIISWANHQQEGAAAEPDVELEEEPLREKDVGAERWVSRADGSWR